MITFSIIIPTFNSEETIVACLESIEQQKFDSVEILIMDGLSLDDTVAIANSFKERLPDLVVVSEKDSGIYDAMNKGIDLAQGEWLYFMGSDDAFYDSFVLEKINDVIKNTKTEVVYGNAKIVGDTGWAMDGDIYDGQFDLPKLLNKNICHQALFYNTLFVKEKVGYFNISYKKSADWDFNLRCWAKGDFVFIDIIVALFAAGGASTDTTDDVLARDFIANLQHYFGWSLFNKQLATPGTWFFQRVLKKQKEKHFFRFKVLNFKNKIKKKLTRLF
ncbi:MAG: glycosyltransferase family 2 protein [Flavobacteriaceae bacterium]